MADVILTVNRIVDSWQNGTLIDPVLSRVPFTDWSADQQRFANGHDRRTFLIVKNTSGAKRYIRIQANPPRRYGAADTYSLWTRGGFAAGQTWQDDPIVAANPDSVVFDLNDGETKIAGPWDTYWFGTDPYVGVGRLTGTATWTGDATAATSVEVGVFYLPRVDSLVGTTTDTPTAEDDPLGGFLAVPEVLTAQTIIPSGIIPTFNDHDNERGWIVPLGDATSAARGDRHLVWLHNGTVAQIIVVFGGGQYGSELSSVPYMLSSMDSGAILMLGWNSAVAVPAGEDIIAGPFDERIYAGGFSAGNYLDSIWIKSTPEASEALFTICPLLLPA